MTDTERMEPIKARLHPDLAERLHEITIIVDGEEVQEPVVRHPLIVDFALQPEYINRLYEQKRKLEARLLAGGKLRELLGLYERPFRLTILMEWIDEGAAPVEELRRMLVWSWVDAECMDAVDASDLVRVFRELRPADGSPIVDREDTPIPQEPIEVWHGGNSEDSMSWTSDYSVAAWFSTRYTRTPNPIWSATIPPDGVLALLSARNESEVVVDPDYLQDVRDIRRV